MNTDSTKMQSNCGNLIVDDNEDNATVTYFGNEPISQQWFIVIFHGKIPMFNAPQKRERRQIELKSIAKSVQQMDIDRRKLMMKIANITDNNNDDCHVNSLQLKFYSSKSNEEYHFEYSIDCRSIDLFRRSKKDRTYFYFTVQKQEINQQKSSSSENIKNNEKSNEAIRYECYMFHAISISNADFIADLMQKQVQNNLKVDSLIDKRKQKQHDRNMKNNKNIENLAEIEKARTCSRTNMVTDDNISQSHVLDQSLDDIVKTMHHVPSLLDLELSCNDQINNNDDNVHHFDEHSNIFNDAHLGQSSNWNNPFLSSTFISMTTASAADNNCNNNQQKQMPECLTADIANASINLNENHSKIDQTKPISNAITNQSTNKQPVNYDQHFRFDEFDAFILKRK